MTKTPPSETLLAGIDNLINEARRSWDDISVERSQVYGAISATFDNDAKLVVIRIQNTDGDDALFTVTSDDYLVFALRLLNKKYGDRLATTLAPSGLN